MEILNKSLPFILLPIITKYLSPEEYGLYSLYQVLITFLLPFIGMSFNSNITRNFYKINKDELSKIVSSILFLLNINVIIGLVVMYIITIFLNNPFNISNELFLLMPIIIYVQVVNGFNLTILRNENKPFKYGLIQISITLLNLVTTLFLLIMFNYGWESLILGMLFGHFVVSILSFYHMYSSGYLNLKFHSFKEIYKISFPLIFHILGGSVIFLSDKLFISEMLGIKEVGLYSVAMQFSTISMIVINSILLAFNPWINKKLSLNDKSVVVSSYLLMLSFVVIGFFVWVLTYFLFDFMIAKEYSSAKGIIIWGIIGFVIRGFYQVMYNVILFKGKTNIFIFITTFSMIINLIMNYYLIQLNGIVGAAQSTIISFSLMFIFTAYYADKYSKYNWIGVKKCSI